MITSLDILYAFTYPFYHTCTLVTQHHSVFGFIPVFAESDIGVTDAGGDKAYQNFVITRTFYLERFNPQRTALLAQDSRLDLVYFHIACLKVRLVRATRGWISSTTSDSSFMTPNHMTIQAKAPCTIAAAHYTCIETLNPAS
jgi:hypothetical protein